MEVHLGEVGRRGVLRAEVAVLHGDAGVRVALHAESLNQTDARHDRLAEPVPVVAADRDDRGVRVFMLHAVESAMRRGRARGRRSTASHDGVLRSSVVPGLSCARSGGGVVPNAGDFRKEPRKSTSSTGSSRNLRSWGTLPAPHLLVQLGIA